MSKSYARREVAQIAIVAFLRAAGVEVIATVNQARWRIGVMRGFGS